MGGTLGLAVESCKKVRLGGVPDVTSPMIKLVRLSILRSPLRRGAGAFIVKATRRSYLRSSLCLLLTMPSYFVTTSVVLAARRAACFLPLGNVGLAPLTPVRSIVRWLTLPCLCQADSNHVVEPTVRGHEDVTKNRSPKAKEEEALGNDDMGQCSAKNIAVATDAYADGGDDHRRPQSPPTASAPAPSPAAAAAASGRTPATPAEYSSFASSWPSPYPRSAAGSPLPPGVASSPATSTPRRFFRRPPSPAKHIKASLAKRFGRPKPSEGPIPEDGRGGGGGGVVVVGQAEGERLLDKCFGYEKNFRAKYEVGKEVGKGHFGHTCLAIAKKGELKGQLVAVKIISKAKVRWYVKGGVSLLASKLDERLNDIVGSAYYVAPEVLHRSYSTEADMWSIGVITYILLCGSRPFWARTESGIFRAVLRADPNFDDSPWSAVSAEAKEFVRRLLNKDYRKRMSAAKALSM
ncbi:hypothetical protein BHE74_00031387 [Ensete ventricosum]|nr:hypothetical protein BHE74_00031387 [Ensete ventricosum]